MAEALRDLGRVAARNAHILLPGFAAMVLLHHGVLDTHATIGGFLLATVILIPMALVAGTVVNGMRVLVFEEVRRLWNKDEPVEKSVEYKLSANLAMALFIAFAFWGAFALDRNRDWILYWIVPFGIAEAGLIAGAGRAHKKSTAEPAKKPRAKKKTVRKKTT